MYGLRSTGYGCEHSAAKTGPKYNVERIPQGKKCTIGEITTTSGRRGNIQFFAVVGILESIPGEFEHQGDAYQAKNGFGNIVLDEESQTR